MNTPAERPDGRWFFLGCALLVVGLIAFFWAFFTCIDQSRRFLLIWLLPLVSGFAAGCFAGSLNVTRNGVIGIAAAGGFGVFLLTMWGLGRMPVDTCGSDTFDQAWAPRAPFQAIFDYQKKNGFYAARVEGRLHAGREEYRAVWSDSTPTCWAVRSGLTKGQFDQQDAAWKGAGYQLQSEHHFIGVGGVPKYQATWAKDVAPCGA